MQTSDYSPGILRYIPFLYVIWSDDLLSVSEVEVVTQAIQNDPALDTSEQETLIRWLDRKNGPSNGQIKLWKQTITNSGVKLIESDPYPLSAFSRKLAAHYKEDTPSGDSLRQIEVALGIQPNHYNHLFEVEVAHETSSHYYDGASLDTLLKGRYAAMIDGIREFLTHPIFTWEIHRDKDVFRQKVLSQLTCLAEEGYGALAYPDTYGGSGDMHMYAAMFENLVYADGSLAVKFGVQFGLFGGSIQKLGTRKHHDRYLKEAGEAKLLGCFAMTETGHGSNVRGIRTTATYRRATDSITLHTPGEHDNKEYIGNALHATMATVFAQLIVEGKNHGVHAVLVPIRNSSHQLAEGVTIADNGYKMGLNGVDNGKIWFNGVEVPRENLLDKYGEIRDDGTYHSGIKDPNKRFFTMLGTLVGGRICVAKGALSGARMALAIAVAYALTRRQFNDGERIQEDLIMDYPSHQLRLIPAIAAAYVYHITLNQLVDEYGDDRTTDKRKIETQVAAVKALVTNYANTTIQECREACGGKGYLLENRIAGLRADMDIFTTFEGDNTVLMQLAAKGVLSEFQSEFNSDGFVPVLKLLGTQLARKIAAINPVYTNKVDKDHLYNPKFHSHAFGYRTGRLTYSLALRIRDYIKRGMPAYQAFLKVQTHLLTLARAYSCELSYRAYMEFTEGISEEKNKLLFRKLGTLYALHEIRKDASWFLEQGYLGSSKSKAIRQRVERLCSELRPHAEVLTRGFGIPDHCLTAPIAD